MSLGNNAIPLLFCWYAPKSWVRSVSFPTKFSQLAPRIAARDSVAMFSLAAAVQAPAVGAKVLRATVFVARASCGHRASFRMAADMGYKNGQFRLADRASGALIPLLPTVNKPIDHLNM